MNPEPKVVMMHGKLLSSRKVNVKEVGTHSRTKWGFPGIVDEGIEDGFNVEDNMEAGDDVTEDGLVSKEGLEEKEVRDTVDKNDGDVKGVFGNESNSNVSAMFLELSSVNLSKNSYDSGIIFNGMPEMPPPVELNLILNPSFNLASDANRDLLGNLVSTVWGNNNVGNERNSRTETSISSGVKDFKMQENNSFKKAVSFSNIVQGTSFMGDNKLNLVPCTIKESRKVMDIDPIIEEGSKKWGLTVVGHFVGFKTSYREIIGHLEKMWRIASRNGTPIIMDKVTTYMCERGYRRASFARVLIKVDDAKGIVDNVEICFKGCNSRPLSDEEKAKRIAAKTHASTKVCDDQKGKDGWGSFNGRGGFSNVQVNNGKRYVPVKNMAKEKSSDMEAHSDEEQDDKLNEWHGIKTNIDVACDMGVLIDEEESSRIKILEGDIYTSKNNFDVNFTIEAENKVVEEMENSEKPLDDKVKEGWTYEMLEFYEARIAEDGQDENQDYKRMKFSYAVEDEVREDLSDFMTKNVVSNTVDASMADMQDEIKLLISKNELCMLAVIETRLIKKVVKLVCNNIFGHWNYYTNFVDSNKGCRIVVGWDQDNIDALLLSSSDQVMHFEVKLLHDKRSFLSLLFMAYEHSKGVADVYKGAREFRSCIEQLDMEDLAMNGMFLPYVTCDHCPSLLVISDVTKKKRRAFRFMNYLTEKKEFNKLVNDKWNEPIQGYAMFVLVKRLKNMKRHIRDLNKKNRNVHESAYKEAALDEERVLKQKSKSFLGNSEQTFPIDMPEDLFKNKVDPKSALHTIREVSKDEVKVSLFDIKDDKAPGPDGFTSKFFKASWGIMGDDLFTAVNEFFISGKCLGLIDPNQSAFIEGRQISDNIMIAQELMCGVNGESHGFFKAKRGLRQGDPVSSYLFTIVMEVFTLMLRRQVRQEKKFKYHWGCRELQLLNLCFADDLMMFCHGDLIYASVMRRAMDEFCLSSGLRPSMTKSTIYFGNVSNEVKEEIKIVMPFCEGTLPVKYLEDWRKKDLSFAGRLQLISSVLSSLNDSGGQRGYKFSVAWKDVYMKKCEGGLGLKSLQVWNEALMAKHLWDVIINKGSIWVKWVKSMWLKGHSIWSVKIRKHTSWGWKQILMLRDRIRNFVYFKIGNGRKCYFWYNRWNEKRPLCNLINYSTLLYDSDAMKIKVADLIGEDRWKWPRSWSNRFKEVLNMWVPRLINGTNDNAIWINKKGKEKSFSVNEVWKGIKCDSIKASRSNCFDTGLWEYNKVFMVDLCGWCNKDRWPNRSVERLAFKCSRPWKAE
ncbi:RNA-directed DNA polymerase, eukaryota, reverse transcriptase zinc-binding domain protein [Tanacetum coccineum]